MTSTILRKRLLVASTALIPMLAFAAPAMAQDKPAPAAVDCNTTPDDPSCTANAIVVTGSILRQADLQTVSPVTRVTAENMAARGLSTTQDAIQQLASNNGPALTNSFTANGAFAAGASAVSMRGLSTNSTLVLFDGLRAAYYPLADDGSRNFVDLNTIPDDIVEEVQVLRDGASSAYGADAIAGVVNIITKREIKGVLGKVEGGISERGDGAQYRLSLSAGHGDIEEDGYNAYISGYYYKSDVLYNRDRGYPFNSDDARNICASDGTCGPNNVVGGVSPDGIYRAGTPASAGLYVRPADGDVAVPGSHYQALGDLAGNCTGTLYTLNAVDKAQSANATAPDTVCQVDYANKYYVINPDIERYGVSTRVTAMLTDSIEAYAEANFMQSTVSYAGTPAVLRGSAPAGIDYPQFNTSSASALYAPGSGVLALPVYVCANGIGTANGLNTGCDASNGTLNPNNPFAAQGQTALLVGRLLNRVTYNETRNRAYRGAIGVKGNITDDITFNFDATAMHNDLRRTSEGYVYIANLLNSIARGTFNFLNPAANSQEAWDNLMPANRTDSTSDQFQVQGTIGAKLADLPGGPLQVGVGGSIRYEAVDAPSGNADYFGPDQRYFSLNAFGTVGSRWVQSAYGELQAPIIKQVELSAAGRFDHYSSGQHAFSPKFGIKVKPVEQLILRATYSKGFRIPSFGEANALPTTGYVANSAGIFNDAFLAQYSKEGAVCTVATFANCPTYIRSGSYGQTTLASPDLKPEKSRSFTAGVFFEPIRNFSFSVDYYNIKKTGVITSPSNAPALEAYYTGQPIPEGYTVIPDSPDTNFPDAKPRVAFVQSHLINANTLKTSGLDFQIDGKLRLTDNISFSSHLEATYVIKLEQDLTDSGGGIERYDGTLGNFNLTAGSGTPKWHGYWLNSLNFGDKYTINGTVNYFGGYSLSAMDQGGTYKDCGLNPGYSPTGCDVPKYITVDLQGAFKVTDKATFTLTVQNLFDNMPPIDVVTYGAQFYNPVQGGNGILGRYFKAGVKFQY